MNRESQDNTLSEGIVLQGMFEDGMSLKTFEMSLRWLYTRSCECVEACDSKELMKLIAMANLFGLDRLVRVCEWRLLKILTDYPHMAEMYIDFAER